MHKVMVFIDYQNFNINLKKHYDGGKVQPVNYGKLGKRMNEIIPLDSEVIKTYVFAYKPCDELMKLPYYNKYYDWLNETLKRTPYLEVIEGRQELRTLKNVTLDINNPDTYYTEEKETDINLATHMVSKGYQNAYDIAILVSGDTDYVNVIKTLHNLGKIIIIAHFKHQNISKYDGIYDSEIILYQNILDDARNNKEVEKENPIETKINSIADDVIEIKKLTNETLTSQGNLQSTVVELSNDVKSNMKLTETLISQNKCDNKKQ